MKNLVVSVAGVFLFVAVFAAGGWARMSGSGKIPITASSEEAKQEFLQGRDLSEKLRLQNSIQHFENAISKDPDFAYAYLLLAQSAPTAKVFFENMKKAVAVAEKVSEGERLLIIGAQAGADGNQMKQKATFEKLVAAYPNDERARFVLGNYYIGIQDYQHGIAEYEKCTKINPDFSPAYNSLGYGYRAIEKYDAAERAFKKYTELIPDDPNPPDSYAELLMKMGRFQESIVEYKKALSIDPNFVNSRVGLVANLTYLGKPDEAAEELQKIYDMARNDGERRTALFNMVVLDVDGGNMDQALVDADKEYAVAEKANDPANMSADLVMRGNVLREMGRYDEAIAMFDRSLKTVEQSSLPVAMKDLTRLGHHYNLATVAVMRGDLKTARKEAAEFWKDAEGRKNAFQTRRAHELSGMIALEEKNYDKAITELKQANQLDPYNLYRLSVAYKGKKEPEKAKEFCMKAAHDNTLPALNYAFVRSKATKMLSAL